MARLPVDFQPNVVAPKDASAARLLFSAAAGFLYSLTAAVALTWTLRGGEKSADDRPVLLAAAVAAWTVALCSFVSDVLLGLARGSRVRSLWPPWARTIPVLSHLCSQKAGA